MRRRGGAEEAKVVIQKDSKQSKKKNYRAALSAFLSHDGWTIISLLLFVCLKKKFSLSLSVVLSSSSSLCKGEQQHKEMRREEEMTFSAKL
jgi:hypothetical protein